MIPNIISLRMPSISENSWVRNLDPQLAKKDVVKKEQEEEKVKEENNDMTTVNSGSSLGNDTASILTKDDVGKIRVVRNGPLDDSWSREVWKKRTEKKGGEGQHLMCHGCENSIDDFECEVKGFIGQNMKRIGDRLVHVDKFSHAKVRYALYRWYRKNYCKRTPLPWCVELQIKSWYPGGGPSTFAYFQKKDEEKSLKKSEAQRLKRVRRLLLSKMSMTAGLFLLFQPLS